jgi:hypothetical protein
MQGAREIMTGTYMEIREDHDFLGNAADGWFLEVPFMSCTQDNQRQQILDHLAHTPVLCDGCHTPMICQEGNLAFGNAQLVTFTCLECKKEKICVCTEKGEIYAT